MNGKIFFIFLLFIFFTNNVYGEKIIFNFTGTVLKEDLKNLLAWKKYLEDGTSLKVEIEFSRTYAEATNNLINGKVDIAYICSSTYATIENSKGIVFFTTPIINNQPVYYAYLVALKNSPFKTVEDFQGKLFAFTDPESTSGTLALLHYLQKQNIEPNVFFRKIIYTYDHGQSINAVLSGFVDGATVDSLVFEQWKTRHPMEAKKIKIIKTFGPFPVSPIVIRKNLPSKVVKILRSKFANMDKDPIGKRILKNLGIDRFVLKKLNSYESIRNLITEHE